MGATGDPGDNSETHQETQEGGVCYLDSPSLRVAQRELGFTFIFFFCLFVFGESNVVYDTCARAA